MGALIYIHMFFYTMAGILYTYMYILLSRISLHSISILLSNYCAITLQFHYILLQTMQIVFHQRAIEFLFKDISILCYLYWWPVDFICNETDPEMIFRITYIVN